MGRRACAVLLLLTSLTFAGLAATSAHAEQPGHIVGNLVGPEQEEGWTLNVEIWAVRMEDGSQTSHTTRGHFDKVDRFIIPNLAPGTYRVFFGNYPLYPRNGADVAPQYYSGGAPADRAHDAAEIVVTSGGTTQLGTTTLRPGAHITGRVLSEDGGTVPGRVVVSAVAPWGSGEMTVSDVAADADGYFDIPALGSSAYTVSVTGSEFSGEFPAAPYAETFAGSTADETKAVPVRTTAGTTTSGVVIRAVRNGRLNGVTLTPTGRPAAGIEVTVPSIGTGNRHAVVTTDAQGRWDAGPVRSGSYAVTIIDPAGTYAPVLLGRESWLDAPGRVVVSPRENTDVRTQLTYAAPRATQSPTIGWDGGQYVPVGTMLTARSFAWRPANATTSVQWLRDMRPIPGATSWSYRVSAADVSQRVHARVFATANGRTSYVDSPDVEGTEFHTSADDPTISDRTPVWGQTLRATPGSAAPTTSTSWQWYRDGTPVPGATSETYVVTTLDDGKRIEVAHRRARHDTPDDPRIFGFSQPTKLVTEAEPVVTASATSSSRGTVTLSVRATASDVSSRLLDGRVRLSRVRGGSDTIKTVTMEDGSLRVTLRKQPRGKRTYYATLHGITHRFTTARSGNDRVSVR